MPIDAVEPAQRERAKAVNFGIVYGQTPYGLAQQLGISPDEAAEFIARYFEQYQGVQRYIENCLSQARDSGVDWFVAASAIFDQKDRGAAIRSLREALAR